MAIDMQSFVQLTSLRQWSTDSHQCPTTTATAFLKAGALVGIDVSGVVFACALYNAC
jgi:hypothetical protein